MYPFSQSVTPAVKTHLDAQIAFVNDLSKSFFQSFQKMCDLNIQLAQTLLEEGSLSGSELLTAQRQSDVVTAATSRAQPAVEKLRSYQQHISRIAAEAQVELARVAEQHIQETTRTARALADEVTRAASEETEKNMRNQQENMRKFSDPFTQAAQMNKQGGTDSTYGRAGASLQSAGQGNGQQAASGAQGSQSSGPQGSAQGSTASPGGSSPGASSGAAKPGSSTARKDT